MFCSKCGSKISEEDSYCPNCFAKIHLTIDSSNNSRINTLIFAFSIIGVALSLIAVHYVIAIMGIMVGLFTLIGSISLFIKNHNYSKISLSLSFSIIAILTNISWFIFYLYVLPKL